MKLIRSPIAAAVVSAIGLGMAGNVQAASYAYSFNDIFNLTTIFTCSVTGPGCYSIGADGAPGTADDIDAFQFDDYKSTSTSSANVDPNNQAGVTSTRDHSASGDPLSNWTPSITSPDALVSYQSIPASAAPANNSFTQLGMAPANGATDYAKADAQIVQEQVTGAADTRAREDAEALITTVNASVASSQNKSTTGFNIGFVVTETWTISIDFNADPFLTAFVTTLGGIGAADMGVSFTIQTAVGNNIVFSWTPDGVVNNAGVGVQSETADDADLSLRIADNTPDGAYETYNPVCSGGVCDFTVLSVVLDPGRYILNFNMTNSVDVSQTAVPEPNIMALMGLGLLGLGYARRTAARKA